MSFFSVANEILNICHLLLVLFNWLHHLTTPWLRLQLLSIAWFNPNGITAMQWVFCNCYVSHTVSTWGKLNAYNQETCRHGLFYLASASSFLKTKAFLSPSIIWIDMVDHVNLILLFYYHKQLQKIDPSIMISQMRRQIVASSPHRPITVKGRGHIHSRLVGTNIH